MDSTEHVKNSLVETELVPHRTGAGDGKAIYYIVTLALLGYVGGNGCM